MFVSLVTFLIAVTLLVPFADKLNELALESRFMELLFETNSKILKDIFSQELWYMTSSFEKVSFNVQILSIDLTDMRQCVEFGCLCPTDIAAVKFVVGSLYSQCNLTIDEPPPHVFFDVIICFSVDVAEAVAFDSNSININELVSLK